MLRRLNRRRGRADPLIALINVVFLLLVFLMVAGTVAPALSRDVELIDTSDPAARPPPDAPVILADGRMVLDGAEIESRRPCRHPPGRGGDRDPDRPGSKNLPRAPADRGHRGDARRRGKRGLDRDGARGAMTAKTAIAAGLAVLTSAAVHGALLGSIAAPAGGTDTPPGVAEVSVIGQSFEDLAAGQLRPVSPPSGAIAPVPPQASATTPTASPSRTPVVTETPTSHPDTLGRCLRPVDCSLRHARPGRRTGSAAGAATDRRYAAARDPPAAPGSGRSGPCPAAHASGQCRPERNRPARRRGSTTGSASQLQGEAEAAPRPLRARDRALSAAGEPPSRSPASTGQRVSRTAIIGFTIAPDGGLAALGIDRSSGDAGFDELALRHIRGAVPFPPPTGRGADALFRVRPGAVTRPVSQAHATDFAAPCVIAPCGGHGDSRGLQKLTQPRVVPPRCGRAGPRWPCRPPRSTRPRPMRSGT